MKKARSLKTAFLAAASLTAAGIAIAPLVAPYDPAPIEYADTTSEQEAAKADIAVNRWLLGGAVAAGLAGLLQLFGWTTLSAAIKRAGPAIAAVPGAAVRFVKDSVTSPFRFLLVAGGLSLFAFTGISFLDVEWLAGLATGAAIAVAGTLGARKVSRIFVRR